MRAAAADVPILQRALSGVYGRGALRYPERDPLQEWLAEGEAAGEAARHRQKACCTGRWRVRDERCVELRPDWEIAQSCLVLTRAKQQQLLLLPLSRYRCRAQPKRVRIW